MMFILRSAFWLTVAFMVVRPDVDMRDAASSFSADAMARGSQFVSQQIDAITCDSLQCLGGKALASAALQSPAIVGLPMHGQPTTGSIPMPRPRPDRAG